METTRKERVRIGAFMLLCGILILVFLGYVLSTYLNREYDNYYTIFNKSVTGLYGEAHVKLNGIDVGNVTGIHIDSANLNQVIVSFRVDKGTPIKKGTRAGMTHGISLTGEKQIILSGGNFDEPDVPEGGFVLVGARDKAVRNLARSALTGLTHGWHVSGDEGGIFITTDNGTIISHPVAGQEGGQWRDPGADNYWEKRMFEGFPVYVVIPKRTAVVERRVLVATSAFLNGMALILAAILVGFVIAHYVRDQLAAQRRHEMEMATNIQESAIPRVFPPFPDETRMDIVATMQAARDIGGDFYDFYFITSDRFMFMIADVSGKGVPAALYMMRAKTTIKGIAQTGLPLAEVAKLSNDALSRDNDASMFVTAWLGELNLATGVVTFVNAGHNPPIRTSSGSAPEFVRDRSGLMLGAMGGITYKSHELTLRPGEALYLYTDGITEQPDERGDLFGEERLRFSLESRTASRRSKAGRRPCCAPSSTRSSRTAGLWSRRTTARS